MGLFVGLSVHFFSKSPYTIIKMYRSSAIARSTRKLQVHP